MVAAIVRVARVTAGLVESNGSLPPGLWLTSPAGWLPRTGISSGTLRSAIEWATFTIFTCVLKENILEQLVCSQRNAHSEEVSGSKWLSIDWLNSWCTTNYPPRIRLSDRGYTSRQNETVVAVVTIEPNATVDNLTVSTVLDLSTIYARAYQHRNSRNVRRARSESEIVFSLILLVVYPANDQTPYSAGQIVRTIQYFSLAIVWAKSGCDLTARTPWNVVEKQI